MPTTTDDLSSEPKKRLINVALTTGQAKALMFLITYAQEQHHNNGVLQQNITDNMLDRLETTFLKATGGLK